MKFEIKGLDKLTRQLEDAQKAAARLDGELGKIAFDPGDLASVETAISTAKSLIDERLAGFHGNPLVAQMAAGLKAHFEDAIQERVEQHRLAQPITPSKAQGTISEALEAVRNSIADLRRADYQSFERHAQRLGRNLGHPALAAIVDRLTSGLDLHGWLKAGEETAGSMVGSAHLEWPESDEGQLGLVILLARHLAANSREALNFAHTFYYNGNSNITQSLQYMVSQVFVPFERDFSAYVLRASGSTASGVATNSLATQAKYPRRVFLVHGHDGEVREAVARFLERLNFEVVILHEKANRGRTIIEKFEENADVGFAIVLLTPDDFGGPAGGDAAARARQNVILELGYFIGKLGRDRVMALKRGDLEVPSDILGVVYTPYDEAGAWKIALMKELTAAEYDIDARAVAA